MRGRGASHWPWSTLEIEPTTDARTIKRAYARLLKTRRPQSDPDAFQRLRAAYTTALEGVETVEPDRDTEPSRPRSDVEVAGTETCTDIESSGLEPSSTIADDPRPRLLAAFDDVFESSDGKLDRQAMRDWLAAPELQNFDVRSFLAPIVFERIADRLERAASQWTPSRGTAEIARDLDEFFNWRDEELRLGDRLGIERAEAVFHLLDPSRAWKRRGFSITRKGWRPIARGFGLLLILWGLAKGSCSSPGLTDANVRREARAEAERVVQMLTAGHTPDARARATSGSGLHPPGATGFVATSRHACEKRTQPSGASVHRQIRADVRQCCESIP